MFLAFLIFGKALSQISGKEKQGLKIWSVPPALPEMLVPPPMIMYYPCPFPIPVREQDPTSPHTKRHLDLCLAIFAQYIL